MPSAYTTRNIQIGINLMVPNAASYLVTAIVYVIPHALAMTIGAEIPFATTDGLGGERLNTTTARPTKTGSPGAWGSGIHLPGSPKDVPPPRQQELTKPLKSARRAPRDASFPHVCRLIALVVLLGLASAGCSRAVVPEQGPTVAPAGYSLPKGAEEVVSPGMDPDLTVEVPVGGLVKMDDYAYQHALDAQIWSVLRLAQVNGETAIYQAVAPGKVSLVISPHGYSCPPLVQDCDTDTRGPLKLLVVVTPT